MKAEDVMTTEVITVAPDMEARDAADILIRNRISAVPVVDAEQRIVGILSNGDLYRRAEIGTDRRRSNWLSLFFPDRVGEAKDFIASHARKVKDLMTSPVVTAAPATPLRDIAALLEKHGIKRVPIVAGGRLVGIVSRSNLVQAFAMRPPEASGTAASDQAVRARALERLREVPGARLWLTNVTVEDGVVHLWGTTDSDVVRQAMRVAVESTPGVQQVADHLYTLRHTAI